MEEIFYGKWNFILDPIQIPSGVSFLDFARIKITGSDSSDNTYKWSAAGLSIQVTGKEWKVVIEEMIINTTSNQVQLVTLAIKKTLYVSDIGIIKSLGADSILHSNISTYPCHFINLDPALEPLKPKGKRFNFTYNNKKR